GQIDKLEKADPSNKAKYEELRGQLKDQVAQREKAMADAVKADKAAVGELQGEVDARSKYVKTRMAKLRKDVKTKYANAIKAAANDPAKVQKLLAAEKKAMAR